MASESTQPEPPAGAAVATAPTHDPWAPYLRTLMQLVAAGLVIHLLELERRAGLPQLAPILVVAFAVHARAPLRFRPAIFVLASIAGLFGVLGERALPVIGLGGVLFGLCSLPVKVWARAALVLGVGAAVALYRVNGTFSWAAVTLPVVGAMFMYRAILFLYDESTSGRQATLAQRMGYFFMLPAICFPLVPVVDYRLWRTRYFSGDTGELYNRGMGWIARGLLHLVLYRVVYHFLVLPEWEVVDSVSALRSMVTVYPTYLRISGQFHFIVGVLVLFGHDLPETNKRYFFATSFTDLWRRANIYWKDFMEKVVFYPAFLRFRRIGIPQPMLVAIALTFGATWLLHSYQWFWLRGDFPVSLQDAIFWTVIGTFVAIDSVRESKKPRRRRKADEGFSVRGAAVHVGKVVWMMTLMSVLWSFWTAPSLPDWVGMVALLGRDFAWVGWYGGAVVLAFGVGIAGLYLSTRAPKGWDGVFPPLSVWTSAPVLAALMVLGVTPELGLANAQQQEVLSALTTQKLNRQDSVTQIRGYYENLMVNKSMTSSLAFSEVGRPEDWVNINVTEHVRSVPGLTVRVLKPNVKTVHKGGEFSTNRWGLRDKEYDKRKPSGTYRVALLGSSYAMGTGVNDSQVFETIVEQYLNDEYAGGAFERYEIINFAQEGYLYPNQVGQCQNQVLEFEPDAVFVVDNGTLGRRLAKQLAKKPEEWMGIYPRPWLQQWADDYGVDEDSYHRDVVVRRSMRTAGEGLPIQFLQDIVEQCGRDGAKLAWMWLPVNQEPDPVYEVAYKTRRPQAEALGMVPLVLLGAFDGHAPDELAVAPWDEHPNHEGHQLLAKALVDALEEQGDALGMSLHRK